MAKADKQGILRQAMRRLALAFLVFAAATLVAYLSLISMELSIAIIAVCSIALFIDAELLRRKQWELATAFKFKHLRDKQDALERRISGEKAPPQHNGKGSEETTIRYKNLREISVPVRAHTEAQKTASKAKIFKTDVKRPINKPHVATIAAPSPMPAPSPALFNDVRPLTGRGKTFPKDELTKRRAPRVTTLEDADALSDMVVEELTMHALRHDRVEAFMQPIIRLPQRQRRFYEVFSRVRAKPGVYLPASRYLELARKNNASLDIDLTLLTQSLEILRFIGHSPDAPSFFINIEAEMLKNTQFMGKLLSFLSKNRDLTTKLVLEIKQSAFHDASLPVLKIISGLSKLGCSFSLDHVTSLEEDISDLQRFNVRYLKIDAQILIDATKNDQKFKSIMKAKRLLEGNSIGVIVEKIENEEMMRQLLDYHLHYGQGYLFGRPDLQGVYEPEIRREKQV